jgi:nicotinamidase-related amidase
VDRRHGLDVPRTLDEACAAARTALVVYDMQVGVLGQIADRSRVIDGVQRALAAARGAGVRVVFMRHVTLPVELMGASQLRMWRAWQGAGSVDEVVSAFPPDAPQSQLVDEVAPGPSEAVLDKLTMSAFEGTPLDIVLRDCGVATVAICGVALEIGIEPTVRHAADLGYVPVVLTDACGAGNAEAGARTLAALEFAGDAFVVDVESFSRSVTSGGSASR